MSMVKVDGAKIKHLREQQGLTQLYLATAVHVTTDTISRWENKRYPSIKKENGLKLAEALNVELDDLLEGEEAADPPFPPTKAISGINDAKKRNTTVRILLLTLPILGMLAAFIWYSQDSSPQFTISAERTAPDHCISGQPFPVLIKISGVPDDKPTSIIVREDLPAKAKVVKVSPEVAGGKIKRDMIKWLRKINDTTTFAYVISVTGEEDETVGFYGTAAISGESGAPPSIGGSSAINIGHFHWADVDKDNTISDSEILAVHDRYNAVDGINVDIDIIEKIWLASGYKWNPATKSLEILKN